MAAIVALLGGMVLRAGREGRRQITGNKARLLEEIAARFPSPSERAAALDALRDLPNPDADPVLHELQNALKAGTQLQASEGGRETSQEIFPKR